MSQPECPALVNAAKNDDIVHLKDLLQRHPTAVNEAAPDGATALMTAALHGHQDACELLVAKGANVNLTNKNGATALIYGAAKGHVNVCQLLLQHGADVNAANLHGNTALMAATHSRNVSIVQSLVARKADVNAANKQGNTALMTVAENPNIDIMNLLLENGADPNAMRSDGTTALMLAVTTPKNLQQNVALLLKHGADPNRGREAPLLLSIESAEPILVELLVDHGGDVNVRDKNGHTPIVHALKLNMLWLAHRLAEKGADMKYAAQFTKKIVVFEHDIAEGVEVPALEAQGVNDESMCGKLSVLHLTNKKGLTLMPAIKELSVHVVEFADSCACITNFDSSGRDVTEFWGFLCHSGGLLRVDLSNLPNVTNFGHNFLRNALDLRALKLCWSERCTAIGDHFAYNCSSLTSVQVAPGTPSSLIFIGDGFFANCPLRQFPFSLLSTVKNIGSLFFAQCAELLEVDTTKFGDVVAIGPQFLSGCSSLASIDLQFCSQLDTIPKCFLEHCCGLTSVDVAPLSHLKTIGEGFMRGAAGLTTVLNADVGFSNVVEFKQDFMRECSALQRIDFGRVKKVQRVGDNFARDSGLCDLDLSRWVFLQHIGEGFLHSNKALTTLHLPTAVQRGLVIGNLFLCRCSALTAVDLRFFACGAVLPSVFLLDCKHLKTIKVPSSRHAALPLAGDLAGNAVTHDEIQMQWSWASHPLHARGVQLAALWLFAGGLEYHNHPSSEFRSLPTEIALEICRFLGTRVEELPFASPEKAREHSEVEVLMQRIAELEITLNEAKRDKARLDEIIRSSEATISQLKAEYNTKKKLPH